MDRRTALAFVERHGVVLLTARGPAPNLAEAIAGAPVRGSWWSHRDGRAMFSIFASVRGSDRVLTCRLIDGKLTLVHRRLWPALVRLARVLPRARLAAIREVHTKSGAHETMTTPFPKWVPPAIVARAAKLSKDAARALLGAELLRAIGRRTRGS